MTEVIFYEKPGCAGNARQKAVLMASGHRLEVRDLLSQPWTPETLAGFFAGLAVPEWFNRSHPRIKSGEIVPEAFTAEEALALMCREPLLIRRPLMQAADRRVAGFDDAQVDAWIGLKAGKAVGDACPSQAHDCQRPNSHTA
ncbi:MAG TPA: ArsC/Spx/MgsR family protein [Candidatus Omnitrophota bacterium]|nr:ArsC/Spx/MgsR family protein [Candidatus Omnitrophota bacterium]